MAYSGKRVLVTGGLGFIGSNLAIRLVEQGAHVTVIDPVLAGCGGNVYNLIPVEGKVRIVQSDIGEPENFRDEIASAQVIFNLAGEISHIHSMQFPERDLQVNTVAQLRFLLECKAANRGVRVVYAGTRQVYGIPKYLPMDEDHPVQPVDFNGVHKFAATMYHRMMSRAGDLDAVVLRLTNVYGPRMALNVSCQGFLSTFLRRLMLGQRLEVFGDGKQLRDPVFVDDAVDAFLLAGVARQPASDSYNIGGPEALSLAEIARAASNAAGVGQPAMRPFPEERKVIDIGSYHTDSSRIGRDLGWRPKVRFVEGIARTLEFYRAELPHYLDPSAPNESCNMPEHSGIAWRLRYAETP